MIKFILNVWNSFSWFNILLKKKLKWKNSTCFWTQFRSDICVRKLRVRTQVQVYWASSEPGICTLCVRAQERAFLLVTIYIHLLAFIIFPYGIPFSLQFSNSMGLLWATISYSSINYFGHINIRNWSPHREQQSTLTRQKSLVGLTYFNASKCHITQF